MRPSAIGVYAVLTAGVLAVALLATTVGAAGIPLPRLAAALGLNIAGADPALLARANPGWHKLDIHRRD